jgi:hypothetical protein
LGKIKVSETKETSITQISTGSEFLARKTTIQFLEDDHARIVANLPRELTPDIDRVNSRRPCCK